MRFLRVPLTCTLLLIGGLLAAPAEAQEKDQCLLLCTPDLAFEPSISFEGFAARPRIAVLEDCNCANSRVPTAVLTKLVWRFAL